MRTSLFFILTIFTLLSSTAFSIDPLSYITFQKSKGHFALAETGKVAPLLVSSTDYAGVARALKNLQGDIRAGDRNNAMLFVVPTLSINYLTYA